MKKLNCMLALFFACSPLVLANQTADASPRRTNTQIIDFILSLQEQRIIAIAEAMPAEKYTFVPTHGKFKGVRTFGEQLKHIAADNYLLGAGILGEKPQRKRESARVDRARSALNPRSLPISKLHSRTCTGRQPPLMRPRR